MKDILFALCLSSILPLAAIILAQVIIIAGDMYLIRKEMRKGDTACDTTSTGNR